MSEAPQPQWMGDAPPLVILAIVGSRKFLNPDAYTLALAEIAHAFEWLNPTKVISGGAEGLDRFGQAYASIRRIPVQAFQPRTRQWEPEGFKERNLLIASQCTHLLSIRCAASNTYGSGFTADAAERLGRVVRRIVVPIGGVYTSVSEPWPEVAK